MFSERSSQTMKCQLGLERLRGRHSGRGEPGDSNANGLSHQSRRWGPGVRVKAGRALGSHIFLMELEKFEAPSCIHSLWTESGVGGTKVSQGDSQVPLPRPRPC